MLIKRIALTGALSIMATMAHSSCDIAEGRVNIVGNEFPAIQSVGDRAKTCANDNLIIKTNLTADHQKINLAGMSGNPAEYTSAIIANSSIVALMNEDVVRPLDDLVAKYGQSLKKNQLISIDGKIMAVAFMANAQHLVYRADILEQAGVDVPKSYEDVLAAAKIIREKGLMKNPIGGAYKSGWNLAQEFTNMYIGFGGKFFKPGSAQVSVNNPQGIATLEMLKKLSVYMSPDYLTHDSNGTSAEWKAGNIAMMSLWGSRIGRLTETEGTAKVVIDNTKITAPMTVGGGVIPATTLWWDGWAITKNISDVDAQATFKVMVHSIQSGLLNDKTMPEAVWLIDGYKPNQAAEGVFAAVKANALPYPMLPYQGLLHSSIGSELNDFMQGKEDAATALKDIEASYSAAAKEKGFL